MILYFHGVFYIMMMMTHEDGQQNQVPWKLPPVITETKRAVREHRSSSFVVFLINYNSRMKFICVLNVPSV